MRQLNMPSYNSLIQNERQIRSIQELYEFVQNAGGSLPFNPNWHTNSSLAQFCQDITADPKTSTADVYYGELECTGLPEGMNNGEVRVEIYPGLNGSKILHLTLISTNLEPYHWEATYYGGNLSEWRSWITEEQFNRATCYEDVYLGMGDVYTDVMIAGNHHDSITKLESIPFVNASGYMFVILPSSYSPTVAMSLIEMPMEQEGNITSEGITYTIWKSSSSVVGSFNLTLL